MFGMAIDVEIYSLLQLVHQLTHEIWVAFHFGYVIAFAHVYMSHKIKIKIL